MNLTGTLSSNTIVDNKAVNCMDLSGERMIIYANINLAGDSRLEQQPGEPLTKHKPVLEAVREFIKNKGLDPVKNEAEISNFAVSRIHENYGEYNLNVRFGDPAERERLAHSINAIKNIKDLPSDSAICTDYAATLSYVLGSVGVKNHYCGGYGFKGLPGRHAFVQLDNSGAIVEATDPAFPYRKNLNGGLICNGQIAITELGFERTAYGGGQMILESQVPLRQQENMIAEHIANQTELAFAKLDHPEKFINHDHAKLPEKTMLAYVPKLSKEHQKHVADLQKSGVELHHHEATQPEPPRHHHHHHHHHHHAHKPPEQR